MLDELAAAGLRPVVVLADSLYGRNVSFCQVLGGRAIPWLLAVPGSVTLPVTGGPVTAWARGGRAGERLGHGPPHSLPGSPLPRAGPRPQGPLRLVRRGPRPHSRHCHRVPRRQPPARAHPAGAVTPQTRAQPAAGKALRIWLTSLPVDSPSYLFRGPATGRLALLGAPGQGGVQGALEECGGACHRPVVHAVGGRCAVCSLHSRRTCTVRLYVRSGWGFFPRTMRVGRSGSDPRPLFPMWAGGARVGSGC
ncbi:transposase [Streptomyces olivoreticuli]